MHFHAGLGRRLVDVDNRLYRASESDAVAVAEAIDLPHRRIFIDPQLAPQLVHGAALAREIERRRRSHQRRARMFDLVGILALLALAATAFRAL